MNPVYRGATTVAFILQATLACSSSTGQTEASTTDESHLVFQSTMAALWNNPDGTQVLQIDVLNDSGEPTLAATGTLQINGSNYTAQLMHATGATGPSTLAAHEVGLLQVQLWGDSIQRCTSLPVAVQYDPTLDDSHQAPGLHRANVQTPCLTWTTPITLRSIPALRDPTVDPAAIAAAAGKTLDDVVSSRVTGRSDGKLCSDCHSSSSAARYNPVVALDGNAELAPGTPIAANQDSGCTGNMATDPPNCALTWQDRTRGWAVRFNNSTLYPLATGPGPKPAAIRAIFSQWLADGAK